MNAVWTRHGTALSILFGLCGVLCGAFAHAAEPQGMAVTVIRAKNACFVDSVQLTGHIEAREEVLVRPDVEGLRISKVLVEDGTPVTSGQALAQLVRPDYMPGSVGPGDGFGAGKRASPA